MSDDERDYENDIDEIADEKKKKKRFFSKKTWKAWKDFFKLSLKTIFTFWVMFPFYSYQLQMFYDQKLCGDDENVCLESATCDNNCETPYIEWMPPYGDGTRPEKVKPLSGGMLSFLTGNISDSAATALANTTAEGVIKQESNGGGNGGDLESKTEERIEGKPESKLESKPKSKKSRWTILGAPVSPSALRYDLKSRKKLKQRGGSSIEKTGKKLDLKLSGYKVLYKALDESLGADKGTLETADQCNLLSFLKQEKDLKKTKSLTDVFCDKDNKIKPDEKKKIAWPYNYIKEYEELIKKHQDCQGQDKYSASCMSNNPIACWKAWFAETQRTSWTSSKKLSSYFLRQLHPYVSSDVDSWLIKCKTASFLDTLQLKINEYKLTIKTETEKKDKVKRGSDDEEVKNLKIEKIETFIDNAKEIIRNIEQTRTTIRDKVLREFLRDDGTTIVKSSDTAQNTLNNRSTIERFIRIMESVITANAYDKTSDDVKPDLKLNNIYTDFLISVLKPEEPKIQSKEYVPPSIFSPLNSTGPNHWKRYFITWFMWAITLGVMAISGFTGFWMTALGAFNDYSYFIYPIISFFILYGVAFYNAFMQPLYFMFYALFGLSNIRKTELLCPNSTGTYQMKQNNIRYYGINMFLTLFIIVTNLGMTVYKVAKGGSSAEMLGLALIALFPLATLVIIAIKIFKLIKSSLGNILQAAGINIIK